MAWKFSKPSTSRPPELYGGSSSAAPDAAQLPAVQRRGQSALALSVPCGQPPLEKPTRLVRAAIWAQEASPRRLDA